MDPRPCDRAADFPIAVRFTGNQQQRPRPVAQVHVPGGDACGRADRHREDWRQPDGAGPTVKYAEPTSNGAHPQCIRDDERARASATLALPPGAGRHTGRRARSTRLPSPRSEHHSGASDLAPSGHQESPRPRQSSIAARTPVTSVTACGPSTGPPIRSSSRSSRIPRRSTRRRPTALRRGALNSVTDLIGAITTFIDNRNTDCQPFIWTRTAGKIIPRAAVPPIVGRTTSTGSVRRLG